MFYVSDVVYSMLITLYDVWRMRFLLRVFDPGRLLVVKVEI